MKRKKKTLHDSSSKRLPASGNTIVTQPSKTPSETKKQEIGHNNDVNEVILEETDADDPTEENHEKLPSQEGSEADDGSDIDLTVLDMLENDYYKSIPNVDREKTQKQSEINETLKIGGVKHEECGKQTILLSKEPKYKYSTEALDFNYVVERSALWKLMQTPGREKSKKRIKFNPHIENQENLSNGASGSLSLYSETAAGELIQKGQKGVEYDNKHNRVLRGFYRMICDLRNLMQLEVEKQRSVEIFGNYGSVELIRKNFDDLHWKGFVIVPSRLSISMRLPTLKQPLHPNQKTFALFNATVLTPFSEDAAIAVQTFANMESLLSSDISTQDAGEKRQAVKQAYGLVEEFEPEDLAAEVELASLISDMMMQAASAEDTQGKDLSKDTYTK